MSLCLLFPMQNVLLYPVPDTAPANVGGGGGSKSELVITWEVSHLSVLLVPLSELMDSPNWMELNSSVYYPQPKLDPFSSRTLESYNAIYSLQWLLITHKFLVILCIFYKHQQDLD